MSKLTICIPTFNSSKYISKCLNSILNQSFKNIKIEIYDDASTDDTLKIVESFKSHLNIKVFKHLYNSGGMGLALKSSIKNCNTEYFTWISSDDEMEKDYLKELIYILDHNHTVGYCFSNFKIINNDGNMCSEWIWKNVNYGDVILSVINRQSGNIPFNGVFRVQFLTEVGFEYILYNGESKSSDTINMINLMGLGLNYKILAKSLFRYRDHSDQNSKLPKNKIESSFNMISYIFDHHYKFLYQKGIKSHDQVDDISRSVIDNILLKFNSYEITEEDNLLVDTFNKRIKDLLSLRLKKILTKNIEHGHTQNKNNMEVNLLNMSKNNIPKIMFTYWSGDCLSYLHVMTIRTVRALNPDFRCIIYTSKPNQCTNKISYTSHEHKKEIKKIYPMSTITSVDNVDLVEVDFKKEYGVNIPLFHTFLADLVRIKKLESHGGIWFDMDILFKKPFPEFLYKLNSNKTTMACSYSDTIATGLISSLPNSPIVSQISKEANKYIETNNQNNFEESGSDYKEQYQAFGPDLWRKLHIGTLNENLNKHRYTDSYPIELIYPYLWDNMGAYYSKNNPHSNEKDVTIGVHWYNGSTESKDFINNDLENIDFDNPKSNIEKDLAYIKSIGIDVSLPSRDKFYKTVLRGSQLSNAVLRNSNLANTDFRDSDLRYADLSGSDLSGSDFRGANLEGVNLTNANLNGTVFESSHSIAQTNKKTIGSEIDKGISIVIACYNRLNQVYHTLRTISKSSHNNFEVIIVDDGSDDSQRILNHISKEEFKFPIDIIEIKKSEKSWVNPCMAYNLGLKYTTKEIVMIQNAEVLHSGDVLKFVNDHIEKKDWITFNCYGLSESDSKSLYEKNIDHNEYFNLIKTRSNKVGGNSVMNQNVDGWLNHFEKHFVAYHYCGAIYKRDLLNYMNGGFSENFKNLVGGDDDHFVKMLIYHKFNFKISEFSEEYPFCIHQWHEKSNSVKSYGRSNFIDTLSEFSRQMFKIGFEPENNIELAPKDQIPMCQRSLIKKDKH